MDHKYVFKVYCKCCNKSNFEKVLLSMFIEPEIVWKTFLLLSGRNGYICRDCALKFIRKVGAILWVVIL